MVRRINKKYEWTIIRNGLRRKKKVIVLRSEVSLKDDDLVSKEKEINQVKFKHKASFRDWIKIIFKGHDYPREAASVEVTYLCKEKLDISSFWKVKCYCTLRRDWLWQVHTIASNAFWVLPNNQY